MKKYVVRLTDGEREHLEGLVRTGKAAVYKIKHAHILLQSDADGPGWKDERVAEVFRCHTNTARNVRQRFVEDGMEAALERKKRPLPARERILDGKAEAHLIALACSDAPKGRVRWTLSLLADKLVELNVVDSISYRTVQRALKKTDCVLTGVRVG